MEIKAKLLKPYTEVEKNKFIATQNMYHYKIEYTEEEIAEAEKEVKRQEIIKQLDSLDLKSIRAIRANDEEYIAQYEAQAQELRRQLQEL